ncbi:MAG: hypothetical protein K2X47_06915 [Bdellovibrionales bacterium]|nr:hypothetical protein [Bdellovibrionales bacterium]
MVIIGCYWKSSDINSKLTIECVDDGNHSWLGPVFPSCSREVVGFSSVDHPTAADRALVTSALQGIVNQLRQHGHTAITIHEKTFTRNPAPAVYVRARGQKAATQLTREVKQEVQSFGAANAIPIEEVEDLPTNKRRNYLKVVNGLFDTYLGPMKRDQKMAVCIALKIANGEQHLETTSNKIIRGWGLRTNTVLNRTDITQRRSGLLAAL